LDIFEKWTFILDIYEKNGNVQFSPNFAKFRQISLSTFSEKKFGKSVSETFLDIYKCPKTKSAKEIAKLIFTKILKNVF